MCIEDDWQDVCANVQMMLGHLNVQEVPCRNFSIARFNVEDVVLLYPSEVCLMVVV